MKNIYLYIIIALIFFMLLIPLLSLKTVKEKKTEVFSENIIEQKEEIVNKTATFRVLKTENGQVENISVSDYIYGVVAAEMSASSSEEALKAQAVAAYTFALYRKEENKEKEYDITDSFSTDQQYISPLKAREKWGEKADEYEVKIKKAIAAVEGEYVSYNGKPALTLYHAISGGKTESCADVFGQDFPYLRSRESIGDLLSADYTTTFILSKAEFISALSSRVKKTGEIIGEIEHRENGYVSSVQIFEKTFSGSEIRTIFSLRSANFDITVEEDKIKFTVRGYGHGVGMSQAGADYMARQGGTYKEILLWYYTGCEIVKN